ncbi:hypothetical protein [Desulfoluna spongiiphila]|uniref:Uncharacterized protein n=1 Tax=Desulfoluna spongiiphila TaxID=419481 RepID=A0A1G5EK20_9BACT|nr:hypothetical protein [Desulfoluna spongiiphila]SCY26768.1 hypothetical protein SAMN05216233_10638 [Desulfoluna spongiiphila]
MNTHQKTLLDEYIPLIIPSIEISIDTEEGVGLSYSHFEWCRTQDVERDSDYMQVFGEGETLEFTGYAGGSEVDLEPYLKGRTFRLPEVSFAFGDKTLVVSEAAMSVLTLSRKMGTTKGTAVLADPTGKTHPGYHYISFCKPLPVDRAIKRFEKMPESERPFIYLELKEFDEMVMVHKSVCKKWSDLGIDCFLSDVPDAYHNLKYLCSDEFSFTSHEMWFDSLDDWQENNFDYSSF